MTLCFHKSEVVIQIKLTGCLKTSNSAKEMLGLWQKSGGTQDYFTALF